MSCETPKLILILFDNKIKEVPRANLRSSNKGTCQIPLLLIPYDNNKSDLSGSSGLYETEAAN